MLITCTQKEFVKIFLKKLGEHHYLCVQRDTLFLADVFENFRNICFDIYELVPASFLTAPELA